MYVYMYMYTRRCVNMYSMIMISYIMILYMYVLGLVSDVVLEGLAQEEGTHKHEGAEDDLECFLSREFGISLRSSRTNSSSPEISTIHLGN